MKYQIEEQVTKRYSIFIKTYTCYLTHRQVCVIQAPVKHSADVSKKKITQRHWGNILNITILKTPVLADMVTVSHSLCKNIHEYPPT